jgi:nitroreductase
MELDETVFRALIHERTHHTVEVSIYHILKGDRRPPPDYGRELSILLDFWKKRGLSLDDKDIQWATNFLELAKMINLGQKLELDTKLPEKYTKAEMETVENLLYKRRSIRQWKEKDVPDHIIDKVLEAGLAAPNACNMQAQRFLVIKDKETMKLIKGDVTLSPVKIVICSDMRIYNFMGFPDHTPQNIYIDAAAVADHMLLMAHALGLGGVWLTHTPEMAEKVRKHLNLPSYLRMDTHIAIGYADEAPIKSARMPLEKVKIRP